MVFDNVFEELVFIQIVDLDDNFYTIGGERPLQRARAVSVREQ